MIDKLKNKNNLYTNIFVVTNLYSIASDINQIKSINKLMSKNDKNILIYDFCESIYLPDNKLKKNLKKINNLNTFLINNTIKNNLKIIFILFLVLFKKHSFKLYLDSTTTIIQLFFLIIFKLKNYKINGLCYTFPFFFKNKFK